MNHTQTTHKGHENSTVHIPATSTDTTTAAATPPSSSSAKPALPALSAYADFATVHLSQAIYQYYAGGANDEITLRDNELAFTRLHIQPSLPHTKPISTTATSTADGIDLSTQMLNLKVASPIGIAPAARQQLCHHTGEVGTATAAAQMHQLMILSNASSLSCEDVAHTSISINSTVPPLLWFQVYMNKNMDETHCVLKRVVQLQYQAIVLTVDTPYLGKREADGRNAFKVSLYPSATAIAST